MQPAPSKTILIVEDERDVVDLLTLNLRKTGGFVISTASDGGDHAANIAEDAVYAAAAEDIRHQPFVASS